MSRLTSRSCSRFIALKRWSRVYQDFSISIETSWLSRPTFGECWDFLDCRDLLFASVEIDTLDQDTIDINRDLQAYFKIKLSKTILRKFPKSGVFPISDNSLFNKMLQIFHDNYETIILLYLICQSKVLTFLSINKSSEPKRYRCVWIVQTIFVIL